MGVDFAKHVRDCMGIWNGKRVSMYADLDSVPLDIAIRHKAVFESLRKGLVDMENAKNVCVGHLQRFDKLQDEILVKTLQFNARGSGL